MEPLELGRFILGRRRDLGLTTSEASRRAGISRAYWRDIEMGKIQLPSLLVLRGLASALEVSVSEILEAARFQDEIRQDLGEAGGTGAAPRRGRRHGMKPPEDTSPAAEGEETERVQEELIRRLARRSPDPDPIEVERGLAQYLRLAPRDRRVIDALVSRLLASGQPIPRRSADAPERRPADE